MVDLDSRGGASHPGCMRFAVTCFSALLLGSSWLTGAHAAPPDCPEDRAIYEGVAVPGRALAFTGPDKGVLTVANGKTRVTYPFTVSSSNGFARSYLAFGVEEAPTSVIMTLNPDFTPYRGKGAAPYLITPDLVVNFYYWPKIRSRPDHTDLLPADVWQLARCAPDKQGSPRSPQPATR